MELWIKHQKENWIVKARSVRIFPSEKDTIYINFGCGDECLMAEYDTKERAEEVFNEINGIFKSLCCVDCYYEMPKE